MKPNLKAKGYLWLPYSCTQGFCVLSSHRLCVRISSRPTSSWAVGCRSTPYLLPGCMLRCMWGRLSGGGDDCSSVELRDLSVHGEYVGHYGVLWSTLLDIRTSAPEPRAAGKGTHTGRPAATPRAAVASSPAAVTLLSPARDMPCFPQPVVPLLSHEMLR
jgi:hypothetical protein